MLVSLVIYGDFAAADVLRGRVTAVIDGDTVTVHDGHRRETIRLSGIDAPERDQPGGAASRERLASRLLDRVVIVEYSKRDRYGRIVGKVTHNERDAGLDQVRAGMAWYFKRYAVEQEPNDRSLYASVERDARGRRLGLWRDDRPIPPWDWRQSTVKTGGVR